MKMKFVGIIVLLALSQAQASDRYDRHDQVVLASFISGILVAELTHVHAKPLHVNYSYNHKHGWNHHDKSHRNDRYDYNKYHSKGHHCH